ncbi:hypothetical protein [Ramlibacter sp. AN1133]|uniref:hypothetical protein n=1 Tax=Ramlibacter sp. AN1133 TaxID=3133429 RepID=UPI0030BE2060
MRSLILAAGLVLAGCAHPWNIADVAPGTPRDLVIARAGQPVRVLPLADGGQRLQYTLQPLGRYAFIVDLDPAGRVTSARQVLTETNFQRIEPGRWTRGDVEREFGPPALVDHVTSFQGDVLTYRWAERNEPMFYWVYVDPGGVVQRAHPGMEFINSPQDRD